MNFFTHLSMADSIFYILEGDITLDYRQFRYGNVLPDLDKSMNRIKHTFEGSIGLVEKVFSSIASERMDICEYSKNLGIITHFACDFFCRYHLDDERHDDYFDHFFYEAKLHATYMESRDDMGRNGAERVAEGKDVREFILSLRKEYHMAKVSPETDILFAISAALGSCEIAVRKQALTGFEVNKGSYSAVMTR